MVNFITKISGACIIFTLLATSVGFTQNYQDTDYRKISLTVSGGASLGDMNQHDYFMASNFSINTKNTPTFGAGFQYALTPAWSLELGYRHAQIKGRTVPFETSMNLITLKNIISLNQIFSVNRLSDRINPFLSAGFGYDMFTYDGPDEEFYAHNSSYNAGIGIAYRLSNAVDLFSHYEYHLASNSTDNEVAGYGADYINTVTAGVRINFGKKDSKHLTWRAAPVEISPSDYNRFTAQANVIDELERRINKIAQRQKTQEQKYEEKLADKSAEIDSLKARFDRLNENADDLTKALTDHQKKTNNIVVNTATGFAETLPGGHYVQIFATYHKTVAQDIREHAAQSLKEVLRNSEQQIFIIQRKQFFEVMIGVFSNFVQAQEVQEVMTQVHKDAYVITFPRPFNLQPDFKDLEILEDKPLVNTFK